MLMLAVVAVALGLAQAGHSHAGAIELAQKPLPLRKGIGAAHDAVATTSKDAQAFYDQGLAYLHSYVWLEAARSFNQALRLDPNLAIAQAQLALAYIELNDPALASEAAARSQALAPKASDHDRVHIDARRLQRAAESDPSKLPAYRAALDSALKKYPHDEELWLARGQAESADPAERGQGSTAASVPFYQKALATTTLAPAHFAAHHYLAHAYENTGRIDESLAESATYARMAPEIPHARHMHGHSLRRTGQMDEAIEEFRTADALETAYFKAEGVTSAHDWHYQHNLDLLATTYQYGGQMKQAESLLKTSFEIPSSLVVQELNKRAWPVFLRARGRTADALTAARAMAAHRSPIVSAMGHVEAGRALLLQGQFQAASEEANAALRLMRSSPQGAGLVATPLKALQGEFFLRTGQRDKGRVMLEEATRELRAAPGPDRWTEATFEIEAIARAARATGAWELADWAARQMIEHDPHYAGAHLARALAARHAGDEKTARTELTLAAQYWAKADPDLPELQQIRGTRP